jgi:hypothetical protein
LPAELIRSEACGVNGILIHRARLRDDEICVVHGMPVTTPARTAFDIGRRDRLETAIIRVDSLANATGLKPADVERLAENHRGARGMVQLHYRPYVFLGRVRDAMRAAGWPHWDGIVFRGWIRPAECGLDARVHAEKRAGNQRSREG